eukprot:evm.model.NODE_31868_length_15142_cov_18.426628.5
MSATSKRRASSFFLTRQGKMSEDEGSEDLDDFIVPDDEDEEEGGGYDGVSKKAKSRKRSGGRERWGRRGGGTAGGDFIAAEDEVEFMDSEEEDELVSRRKKERKERRRGLSRREKEGKKKKTEKKEGKEEDGAASSGTKRRKIVLASDDDDNDDGPSSNSRSSRSSSSASSSSSEEEESSEDEGLMHMRVHAAFAAEQGEMLPLFMQRKAMSTKEAFVLYLEMLARSVADPAFREGMRKNPMGERYGRFSNAKKKLEDLICTKRESLLGSMQWKLLWVEELRGRPRFEFFDILGERPDRCQVCGRRRHPCAFEVRLSGPRYDSMALWESRRWEEALPCRLEVLGTPEGEEEGREAEEEEGEREEEEEEGEGEEEEGKPVEGKVGGWWHAGSTCKYKSLCYSSMIHYKYYLLRRVARRLMGFAVTGARSRRGKRRERELLQSPPVFPHGGQAAQAIQHRSTAHFLWGQSLKEGR